MNYSKEFCRGTSLAFKFMLIGCYIIFFISTFLEGTGEILLIACSAIFLIFLLYILLIKITNAFKIVLFMLINMVPLALYYLFKSSAYPTLYFYIVLLILFVTQFAFTRFIIKGY